jgi:hypothetical protein
VNGNVYEIGDVVEAQFHRQWRTFEVVGTEWEDGEQWLQLRIHPGRGYGMERRASEVRHPVPTPPQEQPS